MKEENLKKEEDGTEKAGKGSSNLKKPGTTRLSSELENFRCYKKVGWFFRKDFIFFIFWMLLVSFFSFSFLPSFLSSLEVFQQLQISIVFCVLLVLGPLLFSFLLTEWFVDYYSWVAFQPITNWAVWFDQIQLTNQNGIYIKACPPAEKGKKEMCLVQTDKVS